NNNYTPDRNHNQTGRDQAQREAEKAFQFLQETRRSWERDGQKQKAEVLEKSLEKYREHLNSRLDGGWQRDPDNRGYQNSQDYQDSQRYQQNSDWIKRNSR